MIDTRLKVFRSVATLLSFTKAANELFISQPAISKHIQELEKEYGVQLFDRIGNRIQLTRAGIIRKTKCFRILERNAKISKTKRNFSRLYPTPQKFKKIDRLRRNEIHLKAVRTSS